MKILYNGDSWCWGKSLDDRDDRYAVQLSKQLDGALASLRRATDKAQMTLATINRLKAGREQVKIILDTTAI